MKQVDIDVVLNFFNGIDWELLQNQKVELLKLPFSDSVQGVIHLIDALQDTAVDANIFKEDQVFG